MYVCMYVCMYLCICMHVCMYNCVYQWGYESMYVCVYVCKLSYYRRGIFPFLSPDLFLFPSHFSLSSFLSGSLWTPSGSTHPRLFYLGWLRDRWDDAPRSSSLETRSLKRRSETVSRIGGCSVSLRTWRCSVSGGQTSEEAPWRKSIGWYSWQPAPTHTDSSHGEIDHLSTTHYIQCIYSHTYIHTYTLSLTRTSNHAYIHTCIQTNIQTHLYTYKHEYFLYTYIHTYIHTYILGFSPIQV